MKLYSLAFVASLVSMPLFGSMTKREYEKYTRMAMNDPKFLRLLAKYRAPERYLLKTFTAPCKPVNALLAGTFYTTTFGYLFRSANKKINHLPLSERYVSNFLKPQKSLLANKRLFKFNAGLGTLCVSMAFAIMYKEFKNKPNEISVTQFIKDQTSAAIYFNKKNYIRRVNEARNRFEE